MKRALATLLCLLLSLAEPSLVMSQGTCSPFRTWSTGESLTASDLNSSFTTAVQTNAEAACIDGMGDTAAQFNDALDPQSGGTAILSTQLYHDIANLRYVIRHTMGFSQWWRAYEDLNFGHRSVRMHATTLTQFFQLFRGEAHLSSASTRFHLFSIGTDREMAAGSAHPESAMILAHVNTTVRFMVGIGGDVHVGNTLMVHAAGTATHAAIFRAPSPGTGLYWPAATHMGISAANTEIARFHISGLALHRISVLGNDSTPRLHVLAAWNTTGNPAAISVDASPTQTGANAYLLMLSTHGNSRFGVRSDGQTVINGDLRVNTAEGSFEVIDASDVVQITYQQLLFSSPAGSSANPQVRILRTWTDGGTGSVIFSNITDTSSAAASLFLDLQRSSASVFAVDKWGQSRMKAAHIGAASEIVASVLHAGGALNLLRATAGANQPGAGGGIVLYAACGTNAGTMKIVAKAGTNNGESTVVDNVGSGVTGC